MGVNTDQEGQSVHGRGGRNWGLGPFTGETGREACVWGVGVSVCLCAEAVGPLHPVTRQSHFRLMPMEVAVWGPSSRAVMVLSWRGPGHPGVMAWGRGWAGHTSAELGASCGPGTATEHTLSEPVACS